MYDEKEFGRFIEDTRLSLGLDATKFGKLIGAQRQTIRQWEKGKGLTEDKMMRIDEKIKEILSNNPDLEIDVAHKEFGEFLHNMRKSVGWNSTQMGEKLGYHQTTILRWEKGNSLSKVDDLHLLEMKIRQVVKEEINERRLALLIK